MECRYAKVCEKYDSSNRTCIGDLAQDEKDGKPAICYEAMQAYVKDWEEGSKLPGMLGQKEYFTLTEGEKKRISGPRDI